jgi:hypothetical protein
MAWRSFAGVLYAERQGGRKTAREVVAEEFRKIIVRSVASLEIANYGRSVWKNSPVKVGMKGTEDSQFHCPRQRQTHREVGTQSYGLSTVPRGDGLGCQATEGMDGIP